MLAILASTVVACGPSTSTDPRAEDEEVCSLVTDDEVAQIFDTGTFSVSVSGPFEDETSTNTFCIYNEPEDDLRLVVLLSFDRAPGGPPAVPIPSSCSVTEQPLGDVVLEERDCPPRLFQITLRRDAAEGPSSVSVSLDDPELAEPSKELLRDLAPRMLERTGS